MKDPDRYRKRALAPLVQRALAALPVVVVTGLRQVGKSTFLQRDPALKDHRYVSLDDFPQLESARRNPEAFLAEDGPLTIDEAQRCPELLVAVKRAVDRDRRPGRFLLSGSANFSLLRGVSETLAGRAVYLTLHPFTRREIDGQLAGVPFLRGLFEKGVPPRSVGARPLSPGEVSRGGLPPVCLGLTRDPGLWFKGYEQTYLERDVRELARLGDLMPFRNLLHLAALRTGQVLNISELGRDAKLSAATTTRHLSLLETSFILRTLTPHLANQTSRLIKSPKLYVTDSGLAAHLTGTKDPKELSTGPMLETYVAQNLAAILEADWPDARLSYWHVQGRHEVDFVVEAGRETLAIEVKGASRWSGQDLSGLKAFLDKAPCCRAAILAYGGTELVPLGPRMWAVPLGVLLS